MYSAIKMLIVTTLLVKGRRCFYNNRTHNHIFKQRANYDAFCLTRLLSLQESNTEQLRFHRDRCWFYWGVMFIKQIRPFDRNIYIGGNSPIKSVNRQITPSHNDCIDDCMVLQQSEGVIQM